LLDVHLGDCGILEGCDVELVIEDLFPFLSDDDEANLFNYFGDEINVRGLCPVG
jgi:hypothetical protein